MNQHDLYAYANPFLPIVSLDSMLDDDFDDESPAGVTSIQDPHRTPEEYASGMQVANAIEGFIGLLSPRQRQIVEAVYWRNETQTEVARSLHITKSAVCQALAKIHDLGRRHLRRFGPHATIH